KLLPTEKQLQLQFKVSRHTIRQDMGILVNEGYVIKKKGAGTYVTNTFISKNSNNEQKKIGVVVTYLSDYIFPSIIRGIEKVLKENGYSLILSSTNNNHEEERRCLEMMLDQGDQGLIIEPTKSNVFNPNLSYYSILKKIIIQNLMLNDQYLEFNLLSLIINDYIFTFLITSYHIDNT